jgi:ppGpp synthetase/RelA/SpoT-type nucleotidyltranferase
MKNIDETLLKRMTDQYASEYNAYRAYAKFLRETLERVCRRYAPGSFVEARAKALASFAEKIVRKQDKFHSNPEYDVTDRCGARVIVQSNEDAATICSYIEKNFLIDRDNSLYHSTHLRTPEFGYRSIHYVVQLKPDASAQFGVALPAGVRRGPEGFKAEIQVRTLAEHVLASGLHDRLYKTPITVPESLKRENARLSATLESVDARYSALASGIDAYLGHYSAYLKKGEIAEEMLILEAARRHEHDPEGNIKLTLRIARLAQLTDNWKKSAAELKGALKLVKPAPAELQVELGYALCRSAGDNPKRPDFKHGRTLLEAVVDTPSHQEEPDTAAGQKLRALAAHRVGWCLSLEKFGTKAAAARYRQAWHLDRSNPYHLAAYVEFEVAATSSRDFVEVMDSILREAIGACRQHIEVGIEVPRAFFTSGRLHLLLGETLDSLNSYVAGVAQILEPDAGISPSLLADELEFLQRIDFDPRKQPVVGLDLVRRVLLIALAAAGDDTLLRAESEPNRAARAKVIEPLAAASVLIVAGGAKGMPADKLGSYATILGRAFRQVSGLIISGGTKSGIPGLVGSTAATVAKKGDRRFCLLGYRAGRFSDGVTADEANYDSVFWSGGDGSSQREPLLAWADLLLAGVEPKNIQLLCINGGDIAAFEMRFALALGARVGVVRGSERAADVILADPYWSKKRRLVPLPESGIDDATMRAFVHNSRFELPSEDLECLAKLVHDNYLKASVHADTDYSPERRRWNELREDFKESNRQQVLYAAEILATQGFVLKKHDGPPDQIVEPDFSAEQIEPMAELEHGRWCIERLTARWVAGPKRDAMQKINPSLKPYAGLDDDIKGYDRGAVRSYAKIFKAGGYAIVEAKSGA